jgi:hypothetical protein
MPALLSEKKTRSRLPPERHRPRLQLLRMAGAQRELAFERDDLRRLDRSADDVPECRLAGCGRDADTGGAAVDVVGDVGGLMRPESARIPRPFASANSGWSAGGCPRAGSEGAGAAPEPERVDRQHRDVGGDVVAAIARGLELSRERLAHDHP